MSKDPFDFSDLTDLPEDLAKRLHSESNDQAAAFAEVVRKGAEAGHEELDINQIMAAAIRMGMEVPTQQTVRNYLNKAVELGMIKKPTRQTYSLGTVQPAAGSSDKAKSKAEATGLADAVATKDAKADPLADI